MSRYAEGDWIEIERDVVLTEDDQIVVVLEMADLHDLRTGQLYRDGSMRVKAWYTPPRMGMPTTSHTRAKVFRGDYRDHARTMYNELRYSIRWENR